MKACTGSTSRRARTGLGIPMNKPQACTTGPVSGLKAFRCRALSQPTLVFNLGLPFMYVPRNAALSTTSGQIGLQFCVTTMYSPSCSIVVSFLPLKVMSFIILPTDRSPGDGNGVTALSRCVSSLINICSDIELARSWSRVFIRAVRGRKC